ncbi:TVP38/TMEM64 family protein [Methylobacterium sp. WL9]|uniref:TVP38/TMEM64 family membrane protein n=1 Tax=Methylobacterium thuringiense TaxID=1003091 RepID=A0ABQ4TJW3_9HYPH|nr:TVP38/TMEM64 family protein [Methylobacterium sp. WL9]GJE55271.1 hypothetical protein EKPJFOCH_1761 [Methylobacterium thuringiense]
MTGLRRHLPIVALGLVTGLPLLLAIASPKTALDAVTWVQAFCEQRGALGPALLLAVQALVAASGVLPASLIGVAAGTLFGTQTGFLVAAAGTMTGALASFGLGRVMRPRKPGGSERRGRLAGLDRSLAKEGWRVVCLLRLSPIMPFAPTSYALSLTSVRLSDYLIGTVASLPALLAYVMIGALGRSGGLAVAGGNLAEWLRIGVLALGIGATLMLMLKLRRLLAQKVEMPAIETGPFGRDPAQDASESSAA